MVFYFPLQKILMNQLFKKKCLIFGATGQIGFELCKFFINNNDVLIRQSNTDITNHSLITKEIENFKPDVLINATGYTNVDLAETEKDLCYEINYKSVKNIIQNISSSNCLFIHFSTDFVFDGKSNDPYTEKSEPNPLNFYGYSKLLADEEIINSLNNYFIFRVSWIYSNRRNNFYLKIINKLRTNKTINVVNDQFGKPTSAFFIAKVVYLLINKYLFDEKFKKYTSFGLYNLTPDNSVSWYNFSKEIKKKLITNNEHLINSKIIPVSSKYFITKAKRPSNSSLNNKKIKSVMNFKFPTWEELLYDLNI